MNKKEKDIKKSLIKTISSVKKKFRQFHNIRTGQELKNDELFKPITGKLEALRIQNDNQSRPYISEQVISSEHADNNTSNDTDSNYTNKDDYSQNDFDIGFTLPDSFDKKLNTSQKHSDKGLRMKKRDLFESYHPYKRPMKPSPQKYANRIPLEYKRMNAKKQTLEVVKNKLAEDMSKNISSPESESDNSIIGVDTRIPAAIISSPGSQQIIISDPKNKKKRC